MWGRHYPTVCSFASYHLFSATTSGVYYHSLSMVYTTNMIGIDEVGRGAWAGPLLVVAARQKSELPKGLADSKKLTKSARSNLIQDIKTSCDLGHGWAKPNEIDELGLSNAMRLAVMRALTEIRAQNDEEIIMDGNINYCNSIFTNVTCAIRADADYPIVSAASIYAKVTRDSLMAGLAKEFPNHGFDSHVGYGTAKHIQALKDHGVTAIHRLSYRPVREFA